MQKMKFVLDIFVFYVLIFFVIWTPKGILSENILRDRNFWKDKMEVPLKNCYLNYMLPEIAVQGILAKCL